MLTLGMQGRKWEIFLSAVDLFSKHGYENITMRDIAVANGMRASSLYNYFTSKESILDHIYDFFRQNLMNVLPDLDSVLAMVPEKSPREVLHLSMSYFDAELQPIMDKVYILAITQAHRNMRAYEVIWEYSLDNSKRFLRAVLQKMIDVGKIEPLDVESFLEVFISFAFTAIFRNSSPKSLGMDAWLKGLDTIFSLVKEKAAPGQ